MERMSGCLLCGQELVYCNTNLSLECAVCGEARSTSSRCEQGHFVCDACHSGSSNDWIETVCLHTMETNAIPLATQLMQSPLVHMHGPEHHFLVPAALLATYYNQKKEDEQKERKIQQARKRGEQVPGGFCGFHGACGAGVGTGIFVSLVTDSTPLGEENWGLSNKMSAESLSAIGEIGGPRCCKRDTYLALQAAMQFANENLDANYEVPQSVQCTFSSSNKQCLTDRCPYFSKQ